MSRKSSTPIRVLQVVTVMNRAGLETMLMNYYRAIDRNEVQFDFLVHRSERGDYDDEIEKLGGKIYRFNPMTTRSMFGYRKKMKNFLLKHPEYKIIHSHLDALSALPLSGAKDAHIPTRIAHSHTNSFDKNAKIIIRFILKRFIRFYSTSFMGCSESAVHFMFGNKVKDYVIINNAIDVAKFTYDPMTRRKIRTELKLNGRFVIGHVGRFSYPKNHEFLIDIFKDIYLQNQEAALILVGTGSEEQKIKEKVIRLGLDQNVLFLGLRTDISILMQAMDVFVMPSHYEGLPVVAIEAQASGLPCYFSDVVTKDVDITRNSHFKSLQDSPDLWANDIVSKQDFYRQDMSSQVIVAGYDIAAAAHRLGQLYADKGGYESY